MNAMWLHRLTWVVLLWLSLVSCTQAAGFVRDLVPDPKTAIKIGAAVLENYLGKITYRAATRDAPLRADLHDDVWSVYPSVWPRWKAEHGFNGETAVTVAAGGGQPVIEISKHDGQIRNIYFAR